MKVKIMPEKKRYILRKYVFANNLNEAIQLDTKTQVEDAWLDGEFKPEEKTALIGFEYREPEEVVVYSPVMKPKKKTKK